MEANASYTTGPVLDIPFRNISIYGMAFSSRATGSANTKAGSVVRYIADSAVTNVQTGGGGQFFTVAGCVFRDGASGDPVGLYIEGAGPCMIYRNQFGYAAAALGPVGIEVHGSGSNNPTDVRIKENLFIACPVGIRLANATAQWISIEDNYFLGCTDALHFTSGFSATVGWLANNNFSTATGAASWLNDGGSGQSAANVTTDTNLVFSNNKYNSD
jgi:hypothetical protein